MFARHDIILVLGVLLLATVFLMIRSFVLHADFFHARALLPLARDLSYALWAGIVFYGYDTFMAFLKSHHPVPDSKKRRP